MVSVDESQGPLAEYTALRAELLHYVQHQGQLLTLQLTSAGAILSLVLARNSLHGLALSIPILSFAIHARAVANGRAIRRIAIYIRDDLSDRVPGGLNWERWVRLNFPRGSLLNVIGRLLTFPGVSLLALGFAFDFVFLTTHPATQKIGLIAAWAFGLCAMLYEGYSITRRS